MPEGQAAFGGTSYLVLVPQPLSPVPPVVLKPTISFKAQGVKLQLENITNLQELCKAKDLQYFNNTLED